MVKYCFKRGARGRDGECRVFGGHVSCYMPLVFAGREQYVDVAREQRKCTLIFLAWNAFRRKICRVSNVFCV